MDKYLVKPTKIVDENGYVFSIDDYVSNKLPCGGSSGSSNGSIINEIINLDSRVETLEESIIELYHSNVNIERDISVLKSQSSTDYSTQINSIITSMGDMQDQIDAANTRMDDFETRHWPSTGGSSSCNCPSDTKERLEAIEAYDLDYISRTVDDIDRRVYELEAAAISTTGGDELLVIDQQISTLNKRVTVIENNTTTNTTKIGVHTTDIAALQNRIVDLETIVQTQSRLISELTTRIELLEGK